MCKTGREFGAAVAGLSGGTLSSETLDVRRSVERKDGTFKDGDWYVDALVDLINSPLTPYFFVP